VIAAGGGRRAEVVMLFSRSVARLLRRRLPLPVALGLGALVLGLGLGAGGCGNDGTSGTPDAVMTADSIVPAMDTETGVDTTSDAVTDATPGDVVVPPDAAVPFECMGNPDVPCIDESFQDLGLFETVNAAAVTDESLDGADSFITHIDTTAGGMTPTESFVYVRFTDTGLEKLDISDDDAFSDTDWDLGLRRFVIRLNSGVSGPSCVTAGRTAPGTTFDGLTEVPDGLQYRTEEYFTADCGYVSDGSGIGSPGTALASFWTYPGCVQMTGNVYVVQRADGRHVKLQVLSYYEPDVQQICQDTGALPPNMPSGSGNIRIMWSFLD
jgi:hypothetical protein